MDEGELTSSQLSPVGSSPHKSAGSSWLPWYQVTALTGVVLVNGMAIPVLHAFGAPPLFGLIWDAQVGLAACWMTWSCRSAAFRYSSALLAILLCASSAHSVMAWENETLGMFMQFYLPIVATVHLLLLPTRLLGWSWRFEKQVLTVPPGSKKQFSLLQLLAVLAAWGSLLGYLRWENGEYVVDSIMVLVKFALFALMVVPVAWLVIARQRTWWLVSVISVALFIPAWNQFPQSDLHLLLDLELERFGVIAIWTFMNNGVLFLFGLRGSMSRGAVPEARSVGSNV